MQTLVELIGRTLHRLDRAPRGNLLREKLGELAEFQKARVRVVAKIPLGECAKTLELRHMGLHEWEVE